jgi:hypothetical protein
MERARDSPGARRIFERYGDDLPVAGTTGHLQAGGPSPGDHFSPVAGVNVPVASSAAHFAESSRLLPTTSTRPPRRVIPSIRGYAI